MIEVFAVSEVRTCVVDGQSDLIVLSIRSGTETTHYGMPKADFAGLAKRLSEDARLLTG